MRRGQKHTAVFFCSCLRRALNSPHACSALYARLTVQPVIIQSNQPHDSTSGSYQKDFCSRFLSSADWSSQIWSAVWLTAENETTKGNREWKREMSKVRSRGKWTGRGKDVVNRSERITVDVYMQLRGEWGDRKYKRGRWGKVFGLFSRVMSAVALAVLFNRATSSHKHQPGEMHQRRERNE